jgi:hypothetical protein
MATQSLWCSQCRTLLHEGNRPSRGAICIVCRRSNGRAHYADNREYYVHKARARNQRTRTEVRAWLISYLSEHPCIDCGNDDIRVLEFDHREPGDKKASVSALAALGWSLETVKHEIGKCDVRCANCHRIRTVEQFSWWRARHDSNVQPSDP